MKRVNICLDDRDYQVLRRVAEHGRVAPGVWARQVVAHGAWERYKKLRDSGELEALDQLSLFERKGRT